MNYTDIAKLLSNRINQEHYVIHHLSNVFIEAFTEGVKQERIRNEKKSIDFVKWLLNHKPEVTEEWIKTNLEVYKLTLKDK